MPMNATTPAAAPAPQQPTYQAYPGTPSAFGGAYGSSYLNLPNPYAAYGSPYGAAPAPYAPQQQPAAPSPSEQ